MVKVFSVKADLYAEDLESCMQKIESHGAYLLEAFGFAEKQLVHKKIIGLSHFVKYTPEEVGYSGSDILNLYFGCGATSLEQLKERKELMVANLPFPVPETRIEAGIDVAYYFRSIATRTLRASLKPMPVINLRLEGTGADGYLANHALNLREEEYNCAFGAQCKKSRENIRHYCSVIWPDEIQLMVECGRIVNANVQSILEDLIRKITPFELCGEETIRFGVSVDYTIKAEDLKETRRTHWFVSWFM